MYRILFFLLVFLSPLTVSASFIDVDQDYIYAKGIEYVREKNIVRGYPDGSYRPENLINRAEFAKIVINSAFTADEYEECIDYSLFKDIYSATWFTPYLCVAKREGILHGYPDGLYRPANFINITEAAKILINTFKIESEVGKGEFWYKPYMSKMKELNIIPETVKELTQEITRGEMAQMIYLLHSALYGTNNIQNNQLIGEPVINPNQYTYFFMPYDIIQFDHEELELSTWISTWSDPNECLKVEQDRQKIRKLILDNPPPINTSHCFQTGGKFIQQLKIKHKWSDLEGVISRDDLFDNKNNPRTMKYQFHTYTIIVKDHSQTASDKCLNNAGDNICFDGSSGFDISIFRTNQV